MMLKIRRGPSSDTRQEEFDWKEYIRERQYDDISYRQGEYTPDEDRNDPLERYVSSDVTLPEHLLFQLQCCGISDEETRIGEYIDPIPGQRMVILLLLQRRWLRLLECLRGENYGNAFGDPDI